MRNLFSYISESRAHISGLLEVTDLPNQKLRYIPVPGYLPKLSFCNWLLWSHLSSCSATCACKHWLRVLVKIHYMYSMCNIAQIVCCSTAACFCTSDFCLGWGGGIYWAVSLLRVATKRSVCEMLGDEICKEVPSVIEELVSSWRWHMSPYRLVTDDARNIFLVKTQSDIILQRNFMPMCR